MSGYGEILKYAFIEASCKADKSHLLLEFLSIAADRILANNMNLIERLIKICLELKISVITKDEKESVIKELKDRFGKLSNEILTYIEERYLESLLRKYKIREKDVMETSMLATIIIPSETSDKISGDKLLMNGYRLSEKIDFEYNRNHQMLIKIKKDVNDKKWIYLLSELLEKDNFKN